MQNLIHGLGALGTGEAIAYLFGGALLGMIIGIIPGLSVVVILSLILIFTYHIDLTGALCLFIGAQCGGFYSASVSAILLNTPAHPEALPITFDGYPMARQGNPGRALGLSAASTCVGGFIGCGVLIAFLQVIDDFPDVFHPPEYLALVVLALLLAGTLGTDSVGKAIVAAGAGILISSVGPSAITGTFRYTFGAIGLEAGVSVVALALGMFAIPQMVMVYGTGTATARQDMSGRELGSVDPVEISKGYTKELLKGVLEAFRHWPMLLQSGIVGGVTGIIPGIGGFTGNFMAYGIARQTSRNRHRYGTGIPEGIIAPEGSSLSKEAGHVIPIIGLGIPGGVAGALFIGLFSIKSINVGYGFQQAHPNVTGEIVWIIALSGLIGTLAGVLIGPQIARVTRIPGPLIVPFIFAICISGVFLTDSLFFSVIEILVFAIIGLAFRRLGYPLGSLIIGLVLGSTFETNIYLTKNIYPGISFVAHRPLADVIFLLAFLVLLSKWNEHRRDIRERNAKSAAEIESCSDELSRLETRRQQQLLLAPYPLLALLMDVFLLCVATFFIVYAAVNYGGATSLFPVVGAICVGLPALCFLPNDVRRYLLYRDMRRSAMADPEHGGIPGFGEAASAGIPGSSEINSMELSTASLSKGVDLVRKQTTSLTLVPESKVRSWGPNGQYRRELFALVWLFGLVVLCWLCGFVIGTALFMATYGMLATRRYLRTIQQRVLFAAISTFAIWLVTYEMFHLTGLDFTPML